MKAKYLPGICATFALLAAVCGAQSPVKVFVQRAEKSAAPPVAQNLQTAGESESTAFTAVTKDGRTVILNSNGTWKYAAQTPVNQEIAVDRNDFIRSTILAVTTDQPTYLEKPILVAGTIEASSYYNYGYRAADETHLSFTLEDNSGKNAHVYMQRGELSNQLRAKILASGGKLKGVFVFKMLKQRQSQEPNLSVFAELIGFRF